MTKISSYKEFRLLAEHPQHRNVPAIFLLEVIETEELEEGQLSYYPQYKVRTYSRAYATTLEEAEKLMHQDILYRKKIKETDDKMQDVSSTKVFAALDSGLIVQVFVICLNTTETQMKHSMDAQKNRLDFIRATSLKYVEGMK